MDDRSDDDLRLPPAAVLDTWVVPEPAPDLAERIADAWQAERFARAEPPRRRREYAGVLAGAAFGAALAIAVMLLVRPPANHPVPTSEPPPAAVVAPTAARAPKETARELAQVKADLERLRGEVERAAVPQDDFRLVLDVEPDDAHVRVMMGDRTVVDVLGDAQVVLPREQFELAIEAKGHEQVRISGTPASGPETRYDLALQRVESEPRGPRGLRGFFQRRGKAKPHADPTAGSGDLKNPFAREDDPPKSAKLRIGTSSGTRPARVYVDGTYVGTTPIATYAVTPGRHVVEWYWDDGKTATETVELEANDVRTMKAG